MKPIREAKLRDLVSECTLLISKEKLSREEIVVLLGQLLIRVGYSIHFLFEAPDSDRPEKITAAEAEKLYFSDPTTGTTLMQLGFDLQDKLLLNKNGK